MECLWDESPVDYGTDDSQAGQAPTTAGVNCDGWWMLA